MSKKSIVVAAKIYEKNCTKTIKTKNLLFSLKHKKTKAAKLKKIKPRTLIVKKKSIYKKK